MRFRFPKPVLILAGILAALLAYPVIAWFDDTRSAIYAAGAMAFINAVVGLWIIEWSIDKENFVFMAAYFGGMGARVLIMLLVFAYLLTEEFDPQTLTFFLLGFYFVFLIQEIVFLVKVMSKHVGS